MGLTRNIMEWCDRKKQEAFRDDTPKAYAKAFVVGAVEGACDAAIIWYPVLLVACYCWKNKATKT